MEVLELLKRCDITDVGLVTNAVGLRNRPCTSRPKPSPTTRINVTPMLDLAYVLLVVFILMTTASVQGLSISLPKPSNKPSTEKHELQDRAGDAGRGAAAQRRAGARRPNWRRS